MAIVFILNLKDKEKEIKVFYFYLIGDIYYGKQNGLEEDRYIKYVW